MKKIYLHILTFSIFINLTLAENVPNEIDPISWIIGHKDKWNQAITLKKPVDFTIQNNGIIIGSFKKNIGTEAKVINISSSKVLVSFNGYTASVPIEDTNLYEISKSLMDIETNTSIVLSQKTPQEAGGNQKYKVIGESVDEIFKKYGEVKNSANDREIIGSQTVVFLKNDIVIELMFYKDNLINALFSNKADRPLSTEQIKKILLENSGYKGFTQLKNDTWVMNDLPWFATITNEGSLRMVSKRLMELEKIRPSNK